MGTRAIKQQVLNLLKRPDFSAVLAELAQMKEKEVINALFSGLCRSEEQIRWFAVSAMGAAVVRLANKDIEEARVVMRRMLWSLNDESGGIGWGAPEAMAEIMCLHEGLADEYIHMLISYMRPDGEESWQDGNFLEHEILQQGVMWAVGRLAQCRKQLLLDRGAERDIVAYLDSSDAVVCGLAVRAAGLLGRSAGRDERIRELAESDDQMILLYENGVFSTVSIAVLAGQALERLSG